MLDWNIHAVPSSHPKYYSGNFPKYQHPFEKGRREYCIKCGMDKYAADARSNRVHPEDK